MNELIETLNKFTFNSTVYNSATSWFVVLHVPWCGYCIRFRDKFSRFVKENGAWNNLVKFASLDCQDGQFCATFGLERYPALLFIPRHAHPMVMPKMITAKELFTVPLLQIVIDCLSSVIDHGPNWPHLTQISYFDIQQLGSRYNFRFIVLVDPDISDPVSRAIMFDFAQYDSILPIYRTSYDQANFFNINTVPPAMILFNNVDKTVTRIDNQSLINYSMANIEENRAVVRRYFRSILVDLLKKFQINLDFFFNDELEMDEHTISKTCLRSIPESYRRHLYMDDLESCLHYMFRIEIPGRNFIDADKLGFIKRWVKFLCLFFPGRRHVRRYLFLLDQQLSKVASPLLGHEFGMIARTGQMDAYLPDRILWRHCTGSEPHFRGYPCSVWMLFHVLTVSHYHHAHEADSLGWHYSGSDVIELFTVYITSFFSCSQCADHFKLSTADARSKLPNESDHAIMYLWKIHNHVNQHIAGDITEDPCWPKKQFPDEHDCVGCFDRLSPEGSDWNELSVFNFLVQFYGSHNIIK
ncbi:hypothetical protein ACOME3_010178 [Neoechinorhynchus agilis]